VVTIPLMKTVGVKVLKARLSEYLRLVKAGEVVLVTELDVVVAELRPANRQDRATVDLGEQLEVLAEQGNATVRSESIRGWSGPKEKLRLKGFSTQSLLDAMREDSR
jgi:antitoxin (DNA-binding transcriptional repressor) of toxin-antitoxin stability system